MGLRAMLGGAILLAATVSTPAEAAEFYLFGDSPAGSQALTVNGRDQISAFQTGWFNNEGLHAAGNPNYVTGTLAAFRATNEYRSFFSFVVPEAVTSASLTIGNQLSYGYRNQTGKPLELTLYDVTSPIDGQQQYNGARAIFGDLGTGTVLGKLRVDGPAGSYTINLNQAGVDALNAAYLGAGPFTVGARLALAPVPEPGAWALLLGGFGLMGGALRARRRVTGTYA